MTLARVSLRLRTGYFQPCDWPGCNGQASRDVVDARNDRVASYCRRHARHGMRRAMKAQAAARA